MGEENEAELEKRIESSGLLAVSDDTAGSGDDQDGEGQQKEETRVRKGNRAAGRESQAKPSIATIEDLIRSAYESKARLLEFSKRELGQLSVNDEEIASQSELVAELASKDPVLSAPLKLLQYVAWQGVNLRRAEDLESARVLVRLRDLSLVALSRHPVFATWTDQLADPKREPELSARLFRDAASSFDPTKMGMAGEEFSQRDRERLGRNAVTILGLLRSLQREWTTDRLIDESHESSWSSEAPKAMGLEKTAGTIAAGRDLDVLGLVAANYVRRINGLERRVSELERQLEASANREARLEGQLVEAAETALAESARAEAYSANTVRLQAALAAERDSRVVDQSHMADDYETLRTRIIRTLSGEIDLPTDGLHALRNGSPGVAEEFLDRSLLALTREVEELKDAPGGLA